MESPYQYNENELKEYLKEKGHPYHDPLYTLTFYPMIFCLM